MILSSTFLHITRHPFHPSSNRYGRQCMYKICTMHAVRFLTNHHGLRIMAQVSILIFSCFMLQAASLHPCYILITPTSFFMLPATCLVLFIHPMPHATCLIPRGSWLMPYVPYATGLCLKPHASKSLASWTHVS